MDITDDEPQRKALQESEGPSELVTAVPNFKPADATGSGYNRLGIPSMIIDIFDALPFYVLLVDRDHRIILANTAVRQQLNLEPEKIIDAYCPKVVHGLEEPFDGCPLEEAVEKDTAVEREVFDPIPGRWLNSAIYPTKTMTLDGRRIYFHIVTDVTDRKIAQDKLKETNLRLRALLEHLETVREEERRRIARELHDDTSQRLTGLKANLEAAIERLPDEAHESRDLLKKLQVISTDIMDEIQKLIYELRPTLLDDMGLIPALDWLLDNYLESIGVHVNLRTSGNIKRLPHQLETTIFRVIQEAINNILKHADASHVSVSLYYRKNVVKIRVKDDGKGFAVEEAIGSKDRPRGLGLISMSERVELVNGIFDIRSGSGSGTEINIQVPVKAEVSNAKDTGAGS